MSNKHYIHNQIAQSINVKDRSSYLKGFTLIELLLVILLIGIGLVGVVPNLIKTAVSPDSIETFFNEKIAEAYVEAKSTSRPVYIAGFKNSFNIITFDETRVSIPEDIPVLSAKINGERTSGLEYYIGVYPQGVCDEFKLELEGGTIIESIPLMMHVVRK